MDQTVRDGLQHHAIAEVYRMCLSSSSLLITAVPVEKLDVRRLVETATR
jgi:hypothetical protein